MLDALLEMFLLVMQINHLSTKKEGHYIIIKQSTLQEDITIHNICVSTENIIIYEEKTDTTVRRSR